MNKNKNNSSQWLAMAQDWGIGAGADWDSDDLFTDAMEALHCLTCPEDERIAIGWRKRMVKRLTERGLMADPTGLGLHVTTESGRDLVARMGRAGLTPCCW